MNRRAREWAAEDGVSLIELLLVMALVAVVTAMAVPLTARSVDDARVRSAAGFMAGRLRAARQQAVAASRNVALVFDRAGAEWVFRLCSDGNGNGVRRADIAGGQDQCAPAARVSSLFPTVALGLDAALPAIEAEPGTEDGVRFGPSDIASCSPLGTCSPGTLYLKGSHGPQYAVRVAGMTGRTRVLRYDAGRRQWGTP
jgi:prepilin-type N-terminal cleavage/methylation domain-containing protein